MDTGHTAEGMGSTMTYGGSAGAIVAWGLSWPELAAIVGAVVAVLGLCIKVWAALRRDMREQELHAAQIRAMGSSEK